jgi:hypothetical protein
MSHNIPEKKACAPVETPVWVCFECGKANKSFAKFCGGCGVPPKGAFSRYAYQLKSYLKKIEQIFSSTGRKAVISLAIVGILGTSFLGLSELSATQDNYAKVKWGQIRAHISKTFRLTNSELDVLIGKILKARPEISANINVNHLIELESAIRFRLRDSRVSLFPNPFFPRPDRIITNKNEKPERYVFSDIPIDHPAYQALKSLLDIGINCTKENLAFAPYKKVAWQDWYNTSKSLAELLSLDSVFLAGIEASRSGYINNYELNKIFSSIREKFGLAPRETFAWSSEPYFPSRLEAYSALSSLIHELE